MSLQAIFNCYCKGLRVCLDVLSHFYVSFVAIPFLSCHCFMAISLVGIRKTGSGEGTLLPIFSWGRGDVCTQAYFSGADGKNLNILSISRCTVLYRKTVDFYRFTADQLHVKSERILDQRENGVKIGILSVKTIFHLQCKNTYHLRKV